MAAAKGTTVLSANDNREDAKIKAVWNSMKAALRAGDANKALRYFSPLSREEYQAMFHIESYYLPELAKVWENIGDIKPVSIDKHVAEYEAQKDEVINGVRHRMISTIYFVRETDGNWYIDKFIEKTAVGPYSGKIIDAANDKPIEGVSILVAWKTESHDDVEYIYTDNMGEYHIPLRYIDTTMGQINEIYVTIYQPGYQAMTAQRSYWADTGEAPLLSFEKEDAINKLDRIPPYFDHKAHIEKINRGFVVNELSNRYDWEIRRAGISSDEYLRRKEKASPFSEEIIRKLGDENAAVRRQAARDLAYSNDKRSIPLLISALQDADPWVRYEAAYSLGELHDTEAVPYLLNLVKQDKEWPHKIIQQEALYSINKIVSPTSILFAGGKRIAKYLAGIEGSPSRSVLQRLGTDTIPVLAAKFNDIYLKKRVICIAEYLNAFELMPLIEEATHDAVTDVRSSSLSAFLRLSIIQQQLLDLDQEKKGKENTEKAFQLLIKSLDDPELSIRINSISSLGRFGDNRAIDPLIKTLPVIEQRAEAFKALDNFQDLKILYALIDYFGIDKEAAGYFLNMAQKTCPRYVYVCNNEGTRYASSKNPFKDYQYTEYQTVQANVIYYKQMSHPEAAVILLDKLVKGDNNAKMDILKIIDRFEDNRIQTAVNKLLTDSDGKVKKAAISIIDRVGKEPPVFVDELNVKSVMELPIWKKADSSSSKRPITVTTKDLANVMKFGFSDSIQSQLNSEGDWDPFKKYGAIQMLRPSSDPNELSKYYKEAVTRSISPSDTFKLLDEIKSKDVGIHREAIDYISEKGDRYLVEPLVKLLIVDDKYIRDAAFIILEEFIGRSTIKSFLYDEIVSPAENGNMEAQTLMGELYKERSLRDGISPRPDDNEAMRWFKKAADSGYAPASYYLGNIYETKRGGYEEAFKWYLTAAEKGHIRSQNEIGKMYHYGRSIQKDDNEAFKWYLKAAQAGDPEAQESVGSCYYYGRGVDKDHKIALEWYLKAAEGLSHQRTDNYIGVTAYFKIGEIYYAGQVVPKDLDEAMKWYRKAAEKEHPKAKERILEISNEKGKGSN